MATALGAHRRCRSWRRGDREAPGASARRSDRRYVLRPV